MTPVLAIVGRPNVGKSTLFNRLSRSRDSLVDDQPGVTRDRLYAPAMWGDTPFIVIDTGGFDDQGEDMLVDQVREQVAKAIKEADRILFLMDGHEGLMPGDEEIADILRRVDKRVFSVVNKVDGPEQEHLVHDFYRLGVEKIYPISAAHGYGLKILMEDVTADLPGPEPAVEREGVHRVRVAVLGRPNAGKSSLINRILGSERLLVSELPGTTRDSIDILFPWKGKEYLFIDTAGIRRKSRVKERIEKFSMIKALRSLDRCHIAVILLDAGAGVAEQDARICGYALDRGRGIVLAVNKWDLVKGEPDRKRYLDESIKRQFRFVSFAPRINLSALTGERVKKLIEKIELVQVQFSSRVSTSSVNKALEEIINNRPPPKIGGSRLKFLYATQTGTNPPNFVIFVNRPEIVQVPYRRYIINQFRERLDLRNTPIRLIFRKRRGDQK